jgi:FMN phosphatase YigB (HAD superfamily)
MIQAVLFDLGNTLIEHMPISDRALFHHAARHTYSFLGANGCALPTFEKYYRTQRRALRWERFKSKLFSREMDSRAMLRRMCIDLRLQRDPGTINKLGWAWYEPVVERSSLAADVLPTLQHLRDCSIRMGIIANAPVPGEVIDMHLEHLGILHFFQTRIYSSDIGHRKPEPEIFEEALRELKLPADSVAFVGNNPRDDIKPARRAGMVAILKSKRRPGFGARRAANFVISSIAELPTMIGLGEVPAPKPARSTRLVPASHR